MLLLLHIDDDEDVRPSALAQAMPSFVKLGVIMPEGVDAEALSKAGKEAESAASAHAAAGRKNQNISVASFAQCSPCCLPFYINKEYTKAKFTCP